MQANARALLHPLAFISAMCCTTRLHILSLHTNHTAIQHATTATITPTLHHATTASNDNVSITCPSTAIICDPERCDA